MTGAGVLSSADYQSDEMNYASDPDYYNDPEDDMYNESQYVYTVQCTFPHMLVPNYVVSLLQPVFRIQKTPESGSNPDPKHW